MYHFVSIEQVLFLKVATMVGQNLSQDVELITDDLERAFLVFFCRSYQSQLQIGPGLLVTQPFPM